VIGVDELRLRWIGHRLRAEATIRVDADLTLVAAHEIADHARHHLLHDVPRLADATIHVNPDGVAHHLTDHHFTRG
jgi:divalent metal cation (Fe/Co/Zn/Cd) transporter